MNGLRVVLLVLGLVVIALIYLWGTAAARRRARPLRGRRRPAGGWRWPAFGGRPTRERRRAAEDELDELPSIRNLDALERLGGAGADPTLAGDPGPGGETSRPPPPQPRDIIALYVTAPEGTGFAGDALREALDGVGLEFGDMQIYHHFGFGRMSADRPLFSLASMVEPGSFDPETMDQSTTPGLALFMQIPNPVDPKVCFELMLSTAHRLAEALGGEVREDHRTPVKVDSIERLRARAGRGPHG